MTMNEVLLAIYHVQIKKKEQTYMFVVQFIQNKQITAFMAEGKKPGVNII